MVSSSKILTVSYGTFSCTLEGFDDSFDTMKAIAEYFRDLAQDDRYFGAEPPTPDAEMLARIAEREIARRVEARFEENGGVVLRPRLSDDSVSAPVRDDAQDAAPAETVKRESAAVEAAAPAPQPEPEPEAEAPVAEITSTETEAAQTAQPDDTRIEEDDALAAALDAQVEADVTSADAIQATDAYEETEEAEDIPAPAPAPAAQENSVAAKLARIRAVVSAQGAPAAAAAAPIAAASAFTEDEHAEDMAESGSATDRDAAAPAAEELHAEVAQDTADTNADDDFDTDALAAAMRASLLDDAETEEAAARPAEAPEAVTDEEDSADDIDALFGDTISSFVAQNTTDMPATDAVADEDHADATDEIEEASSEDAQDDVFVTAQASDDDADFDFDEMLALSRSDADDAEARDAGADILTESESDVDAVADEALSETDETGIAPAEDAQEDDAPDAAAPVSPRAMRVMKVKRADFDRALNEGALEAVEDEDEADVAEAKWDAPRGLTADSSLSPEEEADLARELAALEAEELSEEDPAPAMDVASEDNDADDAAPEPFRLTAAHAADTETLEDDDSFADELDASDEEDDDLDDVAEADWDTDDEDEDAVSDEDTIDFEEAFANELDEAFADDEDADLRATAQAVEADTDHLDDDADEAEDISEIMERAEKHARRTVKMSSPARAMLTEKPVEDDANGVGRLMDETNREMDEPESKGRRSAIQHLRAAVAATRADRLLGRKADEDEKTERYREDLADVVRPRRPAAAPAATTERSRRPAPVRPAPLKLVAEQRVDVERSQSRPVQPRRVALVDEKPQGKRPKVDQSFAEYAASVGAHDLPELLEAAAAYMAHVEGLPEFSRPQLMTKLREAEQSESSREDRLRVLGKLLRDGKIAKREGGRFTVSEDIGFQPQNRAAG